MTREHPGRRGAHALIALFVAALAAASVAPASPAGAAGTHRAGVVIDTGSEVRRVVITFSEESITGIQALQRAGAGPVVRGYAEGAAVCTLSGVGHAVESCLGTVSDARYWAYWHVPHGQTGFTQATYSRSGAGAVQVHDGDIEGWRFGTGLSQPPPFATINQISPPPPPPPTTPPPSAPPATAGAVTPPVGSAVPVGGITGGAAGVPSGGSDATTRAPGAAVAPVDATAGTGSSTTSTSSGVGDPVETEVAAEQASASRVADGGGGSSLPSIVGFASVVAVLGAGIFFARRARVGRSAGGS